MRKKVLLIILDGFGYSEISDFNAVRAAKTTFIDKLYTKKEFPFTLISASGLDVGLPAGQMGNSEVGHMNIGAGRIVYQDFTLINKSIDEGSFYENEVINEAIDYALKNNSALHLMGLLSDGGVHSHINHLFALLNLANKKGLKDVYIHAYMDGRDTSPYAGKNYLKQTIDYINKLGTGKIATISGRYYAMDRDKRWDRIKLAYDALTLGLGEEIIESNILNAIQDCYDKNETDEFLKPKVIVDNFTKKPIAKIKNNDSIFFFNFRADRARQMTLALTSNENNFDFFKREVILKNIHYATMTQYDEKYNFPVAFKPRLLKNILGEIISLKGLKQLRIAETEKYAHVTYFFNGGEEKVFLNEERILIPSPKVATYDLKPEMSAFEVTDTVIKKINENIFDLIVLNYANGDMVGHTGVYEAAIKAVETLDQCIPKVIEAFQKTCNGTVIVTADHGNCEQMIDYKTMQPFTEHTTNKVPFVIFDLDNPNIKLRENGRLCDIAPTILQIMNIDQPSDMEGKSLII